MKITLSLEEVKQLVARHFECAVEDLTISLESSPKFIERPPFDYNDFRKNMSVFFDNGCLMRPKNRARAVKAVRDYVRQKHMAAPSLAWSVAVVDDFRNYLDLVAKHENLWIPMNGRLP